MPIVGWLRYRPRHMVKIRQNFRSDKIDDIPAVINKELDREEIKARFKPGGQIAVAVGSRGIANIFDIVKATVYKLKSMGTHPFIVPAMGSHGGATAEGQLEVLASYNITEETMGCPIRSSMERSTPALASWVWIPISISTLGRRHCGHQPGQGAHRFSRP